MAFASTERPTGPDVAGAATVAAPLEVTIDRGCEEVVLRVAGELDLANVDGLRGPLLDLTDHPAATIVVDFARCQFIDSTAISTLVRCQRALRVNGRAASRLIVRGGTGQVRSLLELTGMDRVVCSVD